MRRVRGQSTIRSCIIQLGIPLHFRLSVKRWNATSQQRAASPFDMVRISATGQQSAHDLLSADLLEQVVQLADETAATQVVLRDSSGLLVGIYNQYRYWTPSRARLLAGDIVRYDLDAVTGGQ